MILRIAKVVALFAAAGIGYYVGDSIGSRPLDALPYEHWGPSTFELWYRGVFIGVFTTCFAYLASRLLKTPELASLLIAFAFSICLPVLELTSTGELVDVLSSRPVVIWIYQRPYFIGVLVVLGIVYLARLLIQAVRHNK